VTEVVEWISRDLRAERMAFGILDRPARRSAPVNAMSEPLHSPPAVEERDPVVAAYLENFDLLRYIAARKFRIPPPDDEGVVHEVFVTFLRRHSKVLDERKWLVSAVCNASRVYWRSANKHSALHESRPPVVPPTDVGSRVDAGTVLRRLPRRCRELLGMRFYDGYSAPELAVHFGTTTRYAKLMLHRCMTAARTLVRDWRRTES
jgi:DNA-directed RNA polymerase specialized sigma24 family protein